MCSLHRILVPSLVGFTLAACSSYRAAVGDEKSAQPTATGLARSFTVLETRRGSESARALRDERVDYDSEIVVKPDPAKLKSLAGSIDSDSVAGPRATPATSLEALLKPALSSIEDYVKSAAAYSTAKQANISGSLSDDPAWRNFAASNLAAVRNLIEVSAAITAYEFGVTDSTWKVRDADELGITEQQRERLFDREGELQLLFSPDGIAGEFDVDAVVLEVNRVLADEARRVEALGASVMAGNELLVTAELLRGSEIYPVSVAPYSIVEGQSRGAKSRRVSMPSGADLERLEKEYAANERLAKSIESTLDLVGDPAKFAAAMKELAPALDAYAAEAKKRLETKLQQAAAVTATELADVVQAAKTVQIRFEELSRAVKLLVDGAEQLSPPALLRAASEVEGLVRDGLGVALLDLMTKLEAVSMPTPPAVLGELRGLVRSELDEVEKALANTAFGGSLGGLIGSLRQMRALARAEGFAGLKPGKVTRKPFAIDKAPDGVIQLANSPAEADDMLRITYELAPRVATDGKEVTVWRESTLLDIRKFGFYTTYGSQVLFADRIGDGSSRYQAAAGLAVNLHYRPESARSFFDVVAPGIGICVAAPSFENGVELAVGLQATVFNDTIQAGYLYDISVEDDPWAFYFGLDLIQAFRKLD